MKFTPKRTTILFLLVASLVGFLVSEVRVRTNKFTSQEEINEWYGFEIKDDITALRSPITLNSVVEGVFDEDNDARIDGRVVGFFSGLEYQASYSAHDIGESEWFPNLIITLGTHDESALRLNDEDRDGSMDMLHVFLHDHENEKTLYTYMDLNMDGLLDEMLIRGGDKPHRRYILLDYAWVEADGAKNPWGATQWIDEGGTELQRMDFDGTKWIRTNDPGEAKGRPAKQDAGKAIDEA